MTSELVPILILGFRCDVDKICALLGYYAASCGNCLPTFRDNVSVPSSRVKNPRRKESRHRNVDCIWEGARGVVISKRANFVTDVIAVYTRQHGYGNLKER
jgi:hypothetical protein